MDSDKNADTELSVGEITERYIKLRAKLTGLINVFGGENENVRSDNESDNDDKPNNHNESDDDEPNDHDESDGDKPNDHDGESSDDDDYTGIKAKLNKVGNIKDHSANKPSYEFMAGKMMHMVKEVQMRLMLMPTKKNQDGLDDICKCFGGFLVSSVGSEDGAKIAKAMLDCIQNDK